VRALALSPHGLLYLDADELERDPCVVVPNEAATRIEAAFAAGPGEGLMQLGAVEISRGLPPSHAFFRDLARDFVTALCAQPDLEALREKVDLRPAAARLEDLVRATPPMRGAEYVTPESLALLWIEAQGAFRRDIEKHRGTVASYLHAKNPLWNLVGRVYFHLAENKADAKAPFAFLATYTTHVSAQAKPQHRPLGRAVEESAGAGDKRALLALLVPVQRASEKSSLVRAMVDSGDIYHPLAWSPEEAHAFLREVPTLEESGVVVRVPNWWSARRPLRPEVRVTVGARTPSQLGRDALLDFAIDVTLGDEHLTAAELREILTGKSGLRLVKGRWVEIDRVKLDAVLAHWKIAEKEAQDGVSFLEGMRLIAGAGVASAASGADDGARGAVDRAAWSRIQPGPWLTSVLDGLRAPEGLAAADPGAALHAKLRPYQQVGVRWLLWLHSIGLGGCLADDMGLGKTIQVLAFLLLVAKAKRRRASLLIVPASLLANWTSEAARFAPSLAIVVAHPSTMSTAELSRLPETGLEHADAVLTTYGTLQRAAWMSEREWNVVVLDEAQAIKNPGAKQTRAVKTLRARTRIALTGTPVENRLGDLWSLFDFLAPGLLGTAKEFGRATTALAKREHDAYAPLRELVRPYILRRLKSDRRVIADLPDKTEVRTFCHLTKTQAALYAEAVDALKKKLDAADGIARRGAILAALMGFKQICNHPSQWLGDGAWDFDASGKLARLRELCEPLSERQEKVLVFTQFREITEPLARFLAGVFGRPGLVLHGGTPVKERKKLVDAFQADLGPPFFVLSIKAGGTGLNLTAASHVIHFDRWWNPAVEDQATDRAYRIGQKRNVLVHKLVCRGTVEERIDALIASKKGLSKEILSGDGEVTLTEMSNDALMRMVSLDIATALQELP
jgi:superfamily II DNA or RNA helicase